jgi:hypothetical protein
MWYAIFTLVEKSKNTGTEVVTVFRLAVTVIRGFPATFPECPPIIHRQENHDGGVP